jgi:8-oxo-dGTP pyrophosphatase MutT (NUDIX family)
MQNYVLGFLFSHNRDRVVLIRKSIPNTNHPLHWMDGLLNGIGGKVEPGEMIFPAMRREFIEETGLDVDPWRYCGKIEFMGTGGMESVVNIFRAFTKEMPARGEIIQTTDEHVDVYQIYKLNKRQPNNRLDPDYRTVDNLRWIIPAALDIDIMEFEIRIKIKTK